MTVINEEDPKEIRKQMFAEMEQRLKEMQPKEEDSLFYYHSSEDRIVLSHAIFWVMSRSLKGKVTKESSFSYCGSIKKRCSMSFSRWTIISQTYYIIATSCMRCCLCY